VWKLRGRWGDQAAQPPLNEQQRERTAARRDEERGNANSGTRGFEQRERDKGSGERAAPDYMET
jgi:hypothetical protein